MKPIQVILAIGFLALGLLYHSRRKSLGRALTRIGLMIFIFSGAIAIFFPNIFGSLADVLGIGRGADLLLYMTTFSLISFVFLIVGKVKLLEAQITKIVREVSLRDLGPRDKNG